MCNTWEGSSPVTHRLAHVCCSRKAMACLKTRWNTEDAGSMLGCTNLGLRFRVSGLGSKVDPFVVHI